MKKKEIMLGNFLGGLAWGFGTVIGATVVVAILLGILRSFNFLPFAQDIIDNFSINTVNQSKKLLPEK